MLQTVTQRTGQCLLNLNFDVSIEIITLSTTERFTYKLIRVLRFCCMGDTYQSLDLS